VINIHVCIRCEDTWPYVCEISDLTSEQSDIESASAATVVGHFYHSPTRKLFYTVISVILFFLPVTVMSLAYVIIICRLWVHRTPGESALARRTFSGQHSSTSITDEVSQVNVKTTVTCHDLQVPLNCTEKIALSRNAAVLLSSSTLLGQRQEKGKLIST